MKKLLPVLILLLAFIFTGCNKKSDDNPIKSYRLNQIVNTVNGTTSAITFVYDDHNRLIEYYDNSVAKTDNKFIYDANDRLIEQDISEYVSPVVYLPNSVGYTRTEKDVYTYVSANTVNVSVNTSSSLSTSTTSSSQILTLNDKQHVIKRDYGTSQSIYAYDSAGNELSQTDYFNGSTSPGYQFVYTYDQNKGYLSNIKGNVLAIALISWINNPVKETITQYNVTPNSIYTYTSTFEYNADGYPTKETKVQTSSSSSASTTTVSTYTY